MSKPCPNANAWQTFRDSGLLWWVNRSLHVFGWAINFVFNDDGEIVSVYPARTSCRGFSRVSDEVGFRRVTAWLADHAEELRAEVDE